MHLGGARGRCDRSDLGGVDIREVDDWGGKTELTELGLHGSKVCGSDQSAVSRDLLTSKLMTVTQTSPVRGKWKRVCACHVDRQVRTGAVNHGTLESKHLLFSSSR
jgi:hypothetical protein